MSRITDFTLITETIRKEPFQMFWNNCIIKSIKFRKRCRALNYEVTIAFAFVITTCDRWCLPPKIPWFHSWPEIYGQRIEIARPLDEKNTANTYDIDIKPVLTVRF